MPYCHTSFFSPVLNKEQIDKLKWVKQQLEQYTGCSYPIKITLQHDTAFSNGALKLITLSQDFLTSNTSIDEIAGVLAHEWRHLQEVNLTCSHSPHFVRRQNEHQADQFAAKFLAAHGYDIEPLIFYCTKRPEIHGDIHGSHFERAINLRETYRTHHYSLAAMNSDELPKVS